LDLNSRHESNLLCRYQGHIGTYLIMGGVDVTGPHLYEIAAHGSTSKVGRIMITDYPLLS
jgi:20S proteasome alpha/beta subunit